MRVGTQAEEADCRSYIEKSGFDTLDGCVFENVGAADLNAHRFLF